MNGTTASHRGVSVLQARSWGHRYLACAMAPLPSGGRKDAPPSPTTTNGAQTEGWDAGTQFEGREVSAITESMAWHNASARPSDLSFASAPIAVVMSFAVAALSTSHCETSTPARQHRRKRARARQRLGRLALIGAAGGVARREHHPVGIELRSRDLAARQVAVLLGRSGRRRRQNEARLVHAAVLARENSVGRKVAGYGASPASFL
jgi:hypothetical protein